MGSMVDGACCRAGRPDAGRSRDSRGHRDRPRTHHRHHSQPRRRAAEIGNAYTPSVLLGSLLSSSQRNQAGRRHSRSRWQTSAAGRRTVGLLPPAGDEPDSGGDRRRGLAAPWRRRGRAPDAGRRSATQGAADHLGLSALPLLRRSVRRDEDGARPERAAGPHLPVARCDVDRAGAPLLPVPQLGRRGIVRSRRR